MSQISYAQKSYYADNDTRYVFLHGHACSTAAACYQSLQEQLSIPGYFGKNLDALEEVLDDLDWVAEARVKIIIQHPETLMANEPGKKKALLDILHAARGKKMEIIYLDTASA